MPQLPAPELTSGALFVSLGLFALLHAAFASSASRGMPAFRHTLRLWAGALLCIAATAAGFLARPVLPEPLAYTLPNFAIFCAAALMGQAFAALDGGSARRARWSWWGVLLATAALVATQLLSAPYGVLTAVVSLAVGLLLLHSAWLFLPQLRARPRGVPERWVMVSLLTVAATFVLRALPYGLSALPLLVVSLVFVTSGALAFFSLLHERQRLALVHSYQRDSLTGLYTRGVFFEKAQAALQHARTGDAFAVLMVDLDHFKRINDTHGHLAGDRVIAHAARLLEGSTRLHDLVGRYGGEEFCVLLHHCDAARARRFAQRLLRGTEPPVSLRDGRSVPFSISVGFVSWRMPGQAPPLELLLDRADQALLQAKAQGRNRAVEACSEDAGLCLAP